MHNRTININRLDIRLKGIPLDTIHVAKEGLEDALLQTLKDWNFHVSGQDHPVSRVDAGILSLPEGIGSTEINRAIAARVTRTLKDILSDSHTRRKR